MFKHFKRDETHCHSPVKMFLDIIMCVRLVLCWTKFRNFARECLKLLSWICVIRFYCTFCWDKLYLFIFIFLSFMDVLFWFVCKISIIGSRWRCVSLSIIVVFWKSKYWLYCFSCLLIAVLLLFFLFCCLTLLYKYYTE